ncbi:hypothetical protein CsatA_004740 [Cannabis sativa]
MPLLSLGCLGSGSTENEIELEILFKKINDWKLPRVPINQIYKQRFSFFKSTHDHTIGTIEQTINISKEQETIQLLSKSRFEFLRRKFSHLHLGLVQVAIKPMSQESLSTSVLMSLRDCRYLNFKRSLLRGVETNLCNGPVYFDYYPNYIVSLGDPPLEVLTLNIKTGSLPVALIYRVIYKVITTEELNEIRWLLNAGLISEVGLKTSTYELAEVMHVDLTRSRKPKPRIIRLEQVNFPESWKGT